MESEFGEFTGIRFGRRPRGAAGEPPWEYLPHPDFDGIGGLAHLLRRDGVPVAGLPALREARGPGRLWRLWALASFLLRKPTPAARWLGPGATGGLPERLGAPDAVAVRAFSLEETRELERRAVALGVSLNSFLLWALGRASLHWLDSEGQPHWMVPVNMRGGVRGPRDTGNHSAYLQIAVRAEDGPAGVHGRIRSALEGRWHWRSWSAIRIARYAGARGVRRMYRLDRAVGRAWVGSFSNLGVWRPGGESEWFFCPPVSANNPVGAGAVICDGGLTLTLQAHPALGWDSARARELLAGWERELGR
jgi:hypothetical protein